MKNHWLIKVTNSKIWADAYIYMYMYILDIQYLFVCFFDCMGLFIPLEIFLIMETVREKAANFYLYTVLVAIEQTWFYSVQHLLWHGAFVYVQCSSPRNPWHQTCRRAFSSGSFTRPLILQLRIGTKWELIATDSNLRFLNLQYGPIYY